MLARDVEILCGKDVLEWHQLDSFFRFLEYRSSKASDEFHCRSSDLLDEEYNEIRDDHNERELPHREVLASDASKFFISDDNPPADNVFGSKYMPKFILVVQRHHSDTLCYDLRDKLFGLLGLDPQMKEFTLDYHSSPWELYVKVLVYLQRRHALMPALLVSQVLQKALLIQSHERPVYEAIRSLEPVYNHGDRLFRDKVRAVRTVSRVGATTGNEGKVSPEELETIRDSLGLQWTSAERSFSDRDFSSSQQSLLVNLATREDMFLSSTFNLPACSATMSPAKSSDLQDAFLQVLRAPLDYVGLGGPSVAPGDIICQELEIEAPMFAIRNPDARTEVHSLVGRCFVYTLVDEIEKQTAREDMGVDLTHINNGEVSGTYWAPQVTRYMPTIAAGPPGVCDDELCFDLEALASMSAHSDYWISNSSEPWFESVQVMARLETSTDA
ncbi:putative Heterokaryon incompatibility domain-containing protein [Seiridium unicorne]|uniref:Heterokaryon incompatibility domain-containing protein n=1 Tax=Seiridium unicorne TaxID=138068 RepID=A0ABR2UH44_9PEZI